MGFFKKFFIYRSLVNPKAQATVEYILLLVVVMAIALGIGGPLGNHLKNFSGAMVGPDGYYACLTKNGVLPGPAYKSQLPPGVDCGQSVSLALTNLDQIAGPGGINQGPGGLGGSGISGSNSSSSGSSSSSSSSGSSGNTTNAGGAGSNNNQGRLNQAGRKRGSSRHKVKKASSSKSGSVAGSIDGSVSDLSSQPSFLANKSKANGGGINKRKKRKFKAGGEESVGSGFSGKKKKKKKNSVQDEGNRGQAYLGDQIYSIEETKQNKETFKAKEISKKATKAGEEKKSDRIQSEKAKKAKVLEDENKKLNFGNFLKYIIIAIMIIFVIVVVFSQIMEYQSKD